MYPGLSLADEKSLERNEKKTQIMMGFNKCLSVSGIYNIFEIINNIKSIA